MQFDQTEYRSHKVHDSKILVYGYRKKYQYSGYPEQQEPYTGLRSCQRMPGRKKTDRDKDKTQRDFGALQRKVILFQKERRRDQKHTAKQIPHIIFRKQTSFDNRAFLFIGRPQIQEI